MESELAAKMAQLAALEEENRLLKNKHEALEHTIGIQHNMVEQICAQQQAAAANSSSSGQGDVAAVVAAVTGTAAATDLSPNNSQPGQTENISNPDWAGIIRSASHNAGSSSSSLIKPDQMNVPLLLDRYRHYVAAAAHGLNQLAAALQQQQPEKFTVGTLVAPAAVGEVHAENAAALGVNLPKAPFTLAEFMALGNDERIPPALPAINLLTGVGWPDVIDVVIHR